MALPSGPRRQTAVQPCHQIYMENSQLQSGHETLWLSQNGKDCLKILTAIMQRPGIGACLEQIYAGMLVWIARLVKS